MAIGRTAYNLIFRRTSTCFVAIIVGALIFETAFDNTIDPIWERMNQGVRNLFGRGCVCVCVCVLSRNDSIKSEVTYYDALCDITVIRDYNQINYVE